MARTTWLPTSCKDSQTVKLICWNVNGIRAVHKKGFLDFLKTENPDVLCVQETKAWPEQLNEEQLNPLGYKSDFSLASKKGYSGVAIFWKEELDLEIISKGIGDSTYDDEGRFLIAELGEYLLYNIYFPSGSSGNSRQAYKYEFLESLRKHITRLPKKDQQRLIICGDYNICHREIDIHHPHKATKQEMSGFLPDERKWFQEFLDLGFTDSFRKVNADLADQYSWWSYRAGARVKNLGWRIDYFLTAQALEHKIKNAAILSETLGSDHAPILLEI